jgi:hypothetical protein
MENAVKEGWVFEAVGSGPKPGKEAEYNTWYDGHIKLLSGFKGLKKVTRSRCFRPIGPAGSNSPKYLTIYEFESQQELDAFYKSSFMKAAADQFKEGKDIVDIFWAGGYETLISLENL